MTDALQLTKRYLEAIERSDSVALEALLADDVVQHEYPNRLLPGSATRDRRAILEAFERGKRALRSQRYELHHTLVGDGEIAFEATWTGVLAGPIGGKAAGDELRARFAVFLRFREGRIVEQRNYDCFDPF